MKKYLYSILAVAAVLSACTKVDQVEKTVEPKDAEKASFYGTIEQPEGLTRTYISAENDEAVSINWSAGDEISVYGLTSKTTKNFVADQPGANVYFGSSDTDAGDFLKDNDDEGYEAYYPVWAKENDWFGGSQVNLDCKSSYTDKEGNNINQASLEYMPMYAELKGGVNPAGPTHTQRPLQFSCAYHAILKLTIPESFACSKMEVIENGDGQVLAEIFNINELGAVNGVKTIYVPIPVEKDHVKTYSSGLTFNAYNGSSSTSVATMFTFKGKDKTSGTETTIGGITVKYNTIYAFDYCNTLTIDKAGTYTLESNNRIDYKVNIAADIDGDVTINAEVDGKEPANIYINNRGHQISDKLTINASKSHVEGENGIATEVEAKTSSSTFVVKPNLTITGLTVKKGSVVVKGKDNKTANVTNITIPAGVTEQITIDVSGVSSNDENGRVKIVNKSVTPVVVVPDNVGDNQKSYKVEEGPVTEAVAMIGTTGYATLAEAIEAATAGQTITLVKDVEAAAGISVASEKDFIVDFGGHTYAMECPGAGSAGTMTSGFQLLKNSTVVFKNGIIRCTDANKDKTWVKTDKSKGIALMIQNYANLTLDDMTIDATNIAHNGAASRYAISNNSGNVEFKGATSIISAAGDYAFDACKYDSYTAPVVTWNSTGTVSGVIELSGGNFIVAKDLKVSRPIRSNTNPSTLTVNSGVTVSPAAKFQKVNTSFADVFNEASSGVVIVNRGGDLTINGEGTITTTKNSDPYCFAAVCMTELGESNNASSDAEKAKLTVEGNVTLEGYYYGIAGNGNRHNTDITISGGTVKGIKANDCTGIYHPQKGNLTISGGTIVGATGIYVKSGDVKASVSAGTIKGVGTSCKAYDPARKGDGCDPTGDALVIDNCGYPGGVPTVEIKGGTFISDHYKAVASYAKTDYPIVTSFITGGTFSSNPSNFLAKGFAAQQNEQTKMYDVVAAQEDVISTQEEFVAACAAAKSGDKLVLDNGEFAITSSTVGAKELAFKGQGTKTIIRIGNSSGDGNQGTGTCNNSPKLSFENLSLTTLSGKEASNYTGFTHEGELYFKDVTFLAGFSNWGNQSKNVTFVNCTFNQYAKSWYCVQELRANPGTKFLFDNCKFICTKDGRFINAYNQYGGEQGVEIVVKDCTFDGSASTQSKAALNLKSGSNGCPINCYFLGRNTVNNVKVQHEATGSALFADTEGKRAKVYVGASKETAVLIWENQEQTKQYIKPEDFNPES